jgi:hypothetical protein
LRGLPGERYESGLLGDELARAERMIAAAIAGEAGAVEPAAPTSHAGLRRLAACFALSPLECDLVLLVLAVEVSPRFGPLFDRLSGRTDGRPRCWRAAMPVPAAP